MQKINCILFLIFTTTSVYTQQASEYYPINPEVVWEYKITLLDSLNTEVDSLHYFRHDKFFKEVNFEGKPTKLVQTKSGPEETIHFQPYLDSMFYSFSGMNGYEYFKLGLVQHLIGFIDSIITDTSFSALHFFQSLEGWYSVYRFGQTVGDEYTIWQLDTLIVFDSLSIPIRLKVSGERFDDDSISTVIGGLNCKKFARKLSLNYLLIIPPLPAIEVPILSLSDSLWIAEGKWMVQGVIPATPVDLSFINLPSFYIPGLITKVQNIWYDTTTAVSQENLTPNEVDLSQNYPNPFNPSTTIRFSVTVPSFTTLKIYNSLGEEVEVLLNKELTTGAYEVEWNASGLPSGVYYYTLNTEGIFETKKMILIK